MGLISYIKKRKYTKIKWENVLFTAARTENFDKFEALNALRDTADMGLLDAKRFLEAKQPTALPVTDYQSFRKIDSALSAAGGQLQAFLNGSQLDKTLIPGSEDDISGSASSDGTDSSAEGIPGSDSSASSQGTDASNKNGALSDDPDEYDYYPDESEEPLIDYATGEIIEKKK